MDVLAELTRLLPPPAWLNLMELNARQVVHRGRHLEIAEIGPAKTDAVVDGRRLQRKRDLVAGVKTYSDTRNGATKCTLYVH